MPITITAPEPNGPFGPGFSFSVTTDFVGPVTSPQFRIELWDTNVELLLYSQVVADPGSRSAGGWYISLITITNPQVKIPTGSAVKLKVSYEGTGGVVETKTQAQVLDEGTGRIFQLAQKLAIVQNQVANMSGVSGDLTTVKANVAQIKSASFSTFDPTTIVPLSELLVAPPLGFLRRELISPDRTGEDALTHPLAPAFGLTWEVIDSAAGIGVAEGAPDRLVTHMLDLELVHTLGDASLETTATVSFDYGDAMWIFQPARPTFVRYWIGPGITLRFHWLVL